ncbi:MAG: 5'-methylthioadenosine/S-adenosylhomocysteine nucleosidase [Candidatus Obscuribacterales bacterium]|nr:5'-methylthioadenosine/S-adenosylhomocysteine nucleosidase [Candidatus Obscuribacterales bacterium]
MNHQQKARIAVVIPIEEEFRAFRDLIPDIKPLDSNSPWEFYAAAGGEVIFVISDCGPVNAAAATERVIAQFSPRYVLHGGCAGACDRELLPGDIIVASSYVINAPESVRQARLDRGLNPSLIRMRREGRRHYLDFLDSDESLVSLAVNDARHAVTSLEPWSGIGWPVSTDSRPAIVRSGRIGSADSWTVDAVELERLNSVYGIDCEDMESAYVAQVCALHRIPCMTVRVISDNETLSPLSARDVKPLLAEAGQRSARVLRSLISCLLVRPEMGNS